jgi:Bax protein
MMMKSSQERSAFLTISSIASEKIPMGKLLILGLLLFEACGSSNGSEKVPDKGLVDASEDSVEEKDDGTVAEELYKERSKVLKGAVPSSPRTIRKKLPGKTEYNSVQERKIAFFETLYPVVMAENERVMEEREWVEKMHARYEERDSLKDSAVTALKALAVKYRVEPSKVPSEESFEALEQKVDIIPAELALIQAANESNWGRSRFAKEGNNLFGQWCFTEGCGIVPKRRSEGSKHEVAAFPNVQFSVRSYIRNLNSHPAYKPLRDKRKEMRKKGKEPTGYALAGGLTKYAGIGHDYVKILRNMMRSNEELIEHARNAPPPILSQSESKEVKLEESG